LASAPACDAAASRLDALVRRLGLRLDVLRKEVAPGHDDEVLAASGDEQFAHHCQTQVAGGQPGRCRVPAGPDRGCPPVTGRDGAAGDLDLADPSIAQDRTGVRVDDAQPDVGARLPAEYQAGPRRVGLGPMDAMARGASL